MRKEFSVNTFGSRMDSTSMTSSDAVGCLDIGRGDGRLGIGSAS